MWQPFLRKIYSGYVRHLFLISLVCLIYSTVSSSIKLFDLNFPTGGNLVKKQILLPTVSVLEFVSFAKPAVIIKW